MRYTIIENALLYAQFKHSNRTWLADFKPYAMKKLADYILGDKCWKLEALQEQGKQVPWHIVLKYEFAVRKKAMDYVKDLGMGLQTALDKAMTDEETRSLYFTSRVTLNANTPRRGADPDEKGNNKIKAAYERGLNQGRQQGGGVVKDKVKKGGGKGKWVAQGFNRGKAKGKGNGKKGGFKLVSNTDDQCPICYAYNWQGCDGSCGMLHVCRIAGCFEGHPMFMHKGWQGGQPPKNAE